MKDKKKLFNKLRKWRKAKSIAEDIPLYYVFSNKDLIDYFKAIQDAMSIKDETLSKINNPAIQINQQQLNVNINTELNNDSRERVLDIVKQIINDGNVDIIEDLEVDNND